MTYGDHFRALALMTLLLLPGSASAKYLFECGLYQVRGQIHAFSGEMKDRGKRPPRMPLLVLWDGSMSRTRIPLKAAYEVGNRLERLARERPFQGEFVIEVREPGLSPSFAVLRKMRLPSAETLVSKVATPKLLKREDCEKRGNFSGRKERGQ